MEEIRRGPPPLCIRVKRHYHNCTCEAVIQCDLHGGRPYDGSATRWEEYHEREARLSPEHYASMEAPRPERVDKCSSCTDHVRELLIATKAMRGGSTLAAGRRTVYFLQPDEDDDPLTECVLYDVTCPKCSAQIGTLALCGSHPDSESFLTACNIDYKIFDYPITRYSHKIDQAMLKHVRLEKIDEECEQCLPD